MKTDDQEDEQLIAGIRRGNEAALQALRSKYWVHLCQFVFSYLGRRYDLAEEGVADVFIRIWQRRETLDISISVRVYLFKAAIKNALLVRRDQINLEEIPIEDVPPTELESTDGNQELKYREFMAEIDALLATMPPEREKVFRMNRFENLRYKEIAEALGISVNVVQKHMDIAKRELAAALPKLRSFLRRDTGTG